MERETFHLEADLMPHFDQTRFRRPPMVLVAACRFFLCSAHRGSEKFLYGQNFLITGLR